MQIPVLYLTDPGGRLGGNTHEQRTFTNRYMYVHAAQGTPSLCFPLLTIIRVLKTGIQVVLVLIIILDVNAVLCAFLQQPLPSIFVATTSSFFRVLRGEGVVLCLIGAP